RRRADGRSFGDDHGMRPRLRAGTPPKGVNSKKPGKDDGRAGEKKPPHTAFMTSEALVPPKPKLLFSTARTDRSLALCGTRSTPSVPSLGLSRLSVGGTI